MDVGARVLMEVGAHMNERRRTGSNGGRGAHGRKHASSIGSHRRKRTSCNGSQGANGRRCTGSNGSRFLTSRQSAVLTLATNSRKKLSSSLPSMKPFP